MTKAPPELVLKDVTVSYDRIPAVHHVSGSFKSGSLTAVAGPNGAGKSTLLKAIMGLISLTSGEINRGGLRPRDIAYLPQRAEIDTHFPVSAGDFVMLGAWGGTGAWGGVAQSRRADARAALDTVGLGALHAMPIGRLSAGQFQRMLFARLILRDCPIVFLDEPFAGVDTSTTDDLLKVIHGWHEAGRSVLAVLHDLNQIEAGFPETLLLARECVFWGKTAEALAPENLIKARQLTDQWSAEAGRRMSRAQP